MKRLLAGAIALFVAGAALAAPPCTLSSDLVQPYHNPDASSREFAAVRRNLWSFMNDCRRGPTEMASRKVLFELVDDELNLDFSRHFDRSLSDDMKRATDEAVMRFRHALPDYLDTVVTPQDLPFKRTILDYGGSLAISKLGRPAKDEVLSHALHAQHLFYAYQWTTSQQTALGALGYWIDPSNVEFSPLEKTSFTDF